MCYELLNKCANEKCDASFDDDEDDSRAVELLPMPLNLCDKASPAQGPLCLPPDQVYVPPNKRQLCTTCNGGKPLSWVEHKAPQAKSSITSTTKLSSGGKQKSGHDSTKGTSSSGQGKQPAKTGKEQSNLPASTSALTASLDRTSIKDGSDEAQIYPNARLPQPTLWQQWRDTEPKATPETRDTRDARYALALKKESGRKWPLPYEARDKYFDRQVGVVGRPISDVDDIAREWLFWRMEEHSLRPSDDSWYAQRNKERAQQVVEMRKAGYPQFFGWAAS